ncbi:MAG: hypothetical protein CMJ95_07325 [Planctomycetes bacterium]|nr:hypothetical protein [Planctomycetota bacterium]
MATSPRHKKPAITVRAAIEQNDEILFLKARDESSAHHDRCWYFLPGGHVNHGETLEQALRREIYEEVGLEVGELHPAFLREFIASRHQRLSPAMPPDHHVIALIYRCSPVAGAVPKIDGPVDGVQGIEQLEWIPRRHLADLDIRPPHLRAALGKKSSQEPSVSLWPEE